MDAKRKTGIWGEVLTVRYLRRGGYEILPISETGMAYNAANIFIETGKKLLKRYL